MVAVRWVKGATSLKDWPGEIKSLQNPETILRDKVRWFCENVQSLEENVA